MKKSLLIILIAALFAACGGGKKAVIDGTVTDIADGTYIYLLNSDGTKIDSTAVAAGKFGFKIAEAYPDLIYLLVENSTDYLQFFVEPGTIVATIDGSATPVTALFSGNQSNDIFAEYLKGKMLIDKKRRVIVPELIASQGTPTFDSIFAIYREIIDEKEQLESNVVLNNANTTLAAYLINNSAYRLMTPEAVDSVLTIVTAAPANAFTDALRERRDLLAASAVGQKAPDFTQAQPDGTPLTLSSLEGQLVLIDFWASWCGPCRGENPNVVKLYDRFHDKGFEILGVSLDDDREDWLEAIEADGLRWKHVSDLRGGNNVVGEQYAVNSIPFTVLVGPDGVIIAKDLRGAALEAKVAEILENEK